MQPQCQLLMMAVHQPSWECRSVMNTISANLAGLYVHRRTCLFALPCSPPLCEVSTGGENASSMPELLSSKSALWLGAACLPSEALGTVPPMRLMPSNRDAPAAGMRTSDSQRKPAYSSAGYSQNRDDQKSLCKFASLTAIGTCLAPELLRHSFLQLDGQIAGCLKASSQWSSSSLSAAQQVAYIVHRKEACHHDIACNVNVR